MNPIKHFEVNAAVLRKCFGEDPKPIEQIKANIYCYPDGQISLESDFQTINNISQKITFEYSGVNEVTDSRSLDEYCAAFFAGERLKTSAVEEPYKGDYVLEGVTSEGYSISANTSVGTKFNNEGIKFELSDSLSDSEKRDFIGLKDLRIDYNLETELGFVNEIRYGLTDIQLSENIEPYFIKNHTQLRLKSIQNIDHEENSHIAKLNSEMILSNIPRSENSIAQQNLYDTSSQLYGAYFTWFQMLLTFSSGHRVRDIYRVETTQTNNGATKVVEYWYGKSSLKKSGLRVIQDSNISEFIIQVAKKVTFDIFGVLGLGLSLSWYIESFDTTTLPTQCLFLYTAIETLNSNFPEERLEEELAVSSDTSENPLKQKITKIKKNNIKTLRDFSEKELVNEECKQRKLDRIIQRLDQACDSLSTIIQKQNKQTFNTFNNLLKSIIIYYRVPYKDLFPDLDIKTVRDKLIHTGLYIKQNKEESTEFYLKLQSLFIRIVLSILEYEGSYFESAPTAEHGIHQLISKDFKRLNE
jgi:hypothetical protein